MKRALALLACFADTTILIPLAFAWTTDRPANPDAWFKALFVSMYGIGVSAVAWFPWAFIRMSTKTD
jgi:hypothetical protein